MSKLREKWEERNERNERSALGVQEAITLLFELFEVTMTDVENIQAQFDDFRDTVTRVLTDLEQKAQNAGNDPQQLAALAQDISNAKAQVVAQDPAPPAPTPAPTGGTPDGTPAPATGVTPATTVPADQTGQTQVPDSQATPPDPQAA